MSDTIKTSQERMGDSIRAELEAATALASEDVKAAVPALMRALEPALEKIHRGVLVDVAEILNNEGMTDSLHLREGPDGIEFASSAPGPAREVPDDSRTIRLTLRIPESLRDAITADSERTGESLNSWIVTAATERIRRDRRRSTTNRATGWNI